MLMEVVEMKSCFRCKKEFPKTLEYFHRKRQHEFTSNCRKCTAEILKIKYHNNPEYLQKMKENSKKTRIKNREKIIKYLNEYYQLHKEEAKANAIIYRKEHAEELKVTKQRKRAEKRKLPRTLNIAQWRLIIQEFNNRCAYCGEEKNLTHDHFIPISKKGGYTDLNIIPACFNCNSSKNAGDFKEWYPRQSFYSKEREEKVYQYLRTGVMQL